MNQKNDVQQSKRLIKNLREKAKEDFYQMNWPKRDEEAWRRLSYEDMDIEDYDKEKIFKPLVRFNTSIQPESFSGYVEFKGNKCVTRVLGNELITKKVFIEVFENKETETSDMAVEYQKSLYQRIKNKFQSENYYKRDHGLHIRVPESQVVEKPFYLVLDEKGFKARRFFHLLIHSQASSQFKIVVILKSSNNQDFLLNSNFHYVVDENASLNVVQHQLLNSRSKYFGSVTADIGRDARFKHFNGIFGSNRSKEFVDFNLEGQGSEVQSNGLYYVKSDQIIDVQSEINHKSPNTSSRTFYKGVVENQGRSVYQGMINVLKGAQGTDAYLTNKNLLLGDQARADSIPSLDIKNNNVKCSHGSTTGKIDKEQLFYLQSRGFSTEQARELLILGYLQEVTLGLSDEEAAWILSKIIQERKVRA